MALKDISRDCTDSMKPYAEQVSLNILYLNKCRILCVVNIKFYFGIFMDMQLDYNLTSFESTNMIPSVTNVTLVKAELKTHLTCQQCNFKAKESILLSLHVKDKHEDVKGIFCEECGMTFLRHDTKSYHIDKVHNKLRYKCNECDVDLSSKGNLKHHINYVHKKIRNFSCSVCDHKFARHTNLLKHKEAVHDKIEKYECKQCDYKASVESNLKSHIRRKHLTIQKQTESYKCKDKECEKTFDNSAQALYHLNKVHRGIKHTCSLCEQKFSTKEHLAAHIKAVHYKERNVHCPQCSYKSFAKGTMRHHIRNVHEKNGPKYECQTCDYKAKGKKNLYKHVKYRHMNPGKSTCDICFAELRDDTIEKHKILMHYSIDEQLECLECGKRFKNKDTLRRHQNVHKNIVYNCEICNFTYKSRSAKYEHLIRVHKKEDLSIESCTKCGYSTSRKGELLRHDKRVHSGIKYYCDKCDYKASKKADVRIHRNAMHEGRKLKCNLCNKEYSRPPALILHKKKTHNFKGGIEPFNCSMCDAKLSAKYKLKRHIDSVHLKITHPCDTCDYKATSKDVLTKHAQAMHQGVKYNCSKCPYQSGFRANVQKHEKAFHSGIKFECDWCEYSCNNKQSLKQHNQKFHNY